MADENGQGPQPEQPGEPENPMEYIDQLIANRVNEAMSQLTAQVKAQLGQMETTLHEKMEQTLAQAQGQVKGQGQNLPVSGGQGESASGKDMLFGRLAALLDNPQSLGELAQAVGNFRSALRGPNDFQLVQEIATRNPAAVMLHAPDPLGGKFPELFTNILTRGIQIGSSGKAGNNPFAPGPAPSPSPNSTENQPSPSDGDSAGISLGQEFYNLDNQAIDDLVGQLMTIKVQRAGA